MKEEVIYINKTNKGYITVEASLVIPLFLLFMLGMAGINMILMAEARIHQALAAATDYVAQCSYPEYRLMQIRKNEEDNSLIDLDQVVDTALLIKQFHSYLGDDYYVERMLEKGKKSIFIHVKRDEKNKKILLVTAYYQVKLNLPLLGIHSINLSNQIKQKAFVGFSKEEYNIEDQYVFVTPNQEAYHMRRDCTHLLLDIHKTSAHRKERYTACFYCGDKKEEKYIYIAKNGTVYHCNRSCIGLKRTVSRVKLSTVKKLGACTRCGS